MKSWRQEFRGDGKTLKGISNSCNLSKFIQLGI